MTVLREMVCASSRIISLFSFCAVFFLSFFSQKLAVALCIHFVALYGALFSPKTGRFCCVNGAGLAPDPDSRKRVLL